MDLIVSVAFSLERSLFDDLIDTISRFKDSPTSSVDDAIIDIRDMLTGQAVNDDFFDALQSQWNNIQPSHIKQLRAEHDEGADRDRDRDHDDRRRSREEEEDRDERRNGSNHESSHTQATSTSTSTSANSGSSTSNAHDEASDKKELDDIPNGPMYTIFVANLNKEVDEHDLRDVFSSIGHIYSTVVVRDKVSRESKCYGFVHFDDEQARKQALETMREVEIKGRRSKCFSADDKNKLFVGNISKHANEAQIRREIERLGGPYTNIEIKLGFAFVTYINFKRAERALIRLQGYNLEGKRLVVEPAKVDKKVDADAGLSHEATHTLYVRNIATDATRDQVEEFFNRHGKVKDVRLKKNDSGQNMGFCHVEFEEAKDANNALEQCKDQEFLGKRLHIEFSRPVSSGGRRSGGGGGGGGMSTSHGGVTLRDERGGGRSGRGGNSGGGGGGGGMGGMGGMAGMGGFGGYPGYPPLLAAAAAGGFYGSSRSSDPYMDPRDQRRRRPSIDEMDRFGDRDARDSRRGGARDLPVDTLDDVYGAMGYAPQMAYDERTRRYVYVTPGALAGAYQAYPAGYGAAAGRDGGRGGSSSYRDTRDSRDRDALRDPYASYRDLPMAAAPIRAREDDRDIRRRDRDDDRDSRSERGEKRYREDDTGDRDRERAKRYRDTGFSR